LNPLKQFFAGRLGWLYVLAGLAAGLLILGAYVRAYSPVFGITKLLQVGQEFDDRGIESFRAAPKYVDPSERFGFDGQFYAELALDPLLRDPQLQVALDGPAYRSPRILMSWLAWLGGMGRPSWILNVYVALNPVFWVAFAVMLAFLFRPHGWAGFAGFAAMLMTCGIIESMQGALTDFPGFVFLTLAMMVGGAGGAGLLALASLSREPNLAGLFALWEFRPPWSDAARRNLALSLIAGVPLALWLAYVLSRFPSPAATFTGGNFAWPMQGIMAKLGEVSVSLAAGLPGRGWFSGLIENKALHAVLTILSVLTQCTFLLVHREWNSRIWRAGVIFVPYFFCISYYSWEDHFTVTRHALPITLAFNLVLALRARRAWPVWFLLGNCFVPYGIYQFTVRGLFEPNAPTEFRIASAPASTPFVRLRFGAGWADEEWIGRHTWRWATAGHATVILANPSKHPVQARLSFQSRSITPREVTITVRGVVVWAGHSGTLNQAISTRPFLVPPGQTLVEYTASGEPVVPGNPADSRPLSFVVQDIELNLSEARPGDGG
jgi:hypothetical protein